MTRALLLSSFLALAVLDARQAVAQDAPPVVAQAGVEQTPALGEPETASSFQGEALRERLASMRSEEFVRLRDTVAQLQAMSADERSALRERLARLAAASAADRARLDANLARWKASSSAERDRLRARWQRFQALPPAEQERLRNEPEAGDPAAP